MPGNPLTDPNWAAEVTAQITTFVGKVRDTTTNKAILVIRGLVFGLAALFVGMVALVVALIALTRGLEWLFDLFLSQGRAVYCAYLLIGAIFTALGGFFWSKRSS